MEQRILFWGYSPPNISRDVPLKISVNFSFPAYSSYSLHPIKLNLVNSYTMMWAGLRFPIYVYNGKWNFSGQKPKAGFSCANCSSYVDSLKKKKKKKKKKDTIKTYVHHLKTPKEYKPELEETKLFLWNVMYILKCFELKIQEVLPLRTCES